MAGIILSIKLTGQFAKLAPAESEKGMWSAEYEDGLMLSALMAQLGVDNTGVKYTVLVNNARKPSDYILKDSDSVTVMPLLAGG